MIHVFSVVVETDDDVRCPSFALDLRENADTFGIQSFSCGVQSLRIEPITGLHRQHLIGENDESQS